MRLVHSWLNPKLEVRSDKGGQAGLITGEALWKGEKLAVYGGHVRLISVEPHLNADESGILQLDEQFVLKTGHAQEMEDTALIRHSGAPNAGFAGSTILVAMRAIALGELISFDQAICLHASRWRQTPYRQPCHCGAKTCRGFVTEDDWRNPELRHRYKGYFSEYLRKKIEERE